ncbi:MAG: sugar transferase [Lachnospiraceae bacterium]|nr:sugar transferase [Lachnospiraceae bacterium]MCI9590362.1 sugar transferase [Lachnospiraceae bacterium]MDE6930847.1 sugar transferase [Lachnospiraceae bacterium]
MYITKINGGTITDIAQYAQHQTAEIAHQLGYREMGIYRYNADAERNEILSARLDGIIAGLRWNNDIVVCQFPSWNGTRFDLALVERIKTYRCRVIIFIQDVQALMFESNRYLLPALVDLYNQAEVLIVPSHAIKNFLLENGVREDMKVVVQEIWDYTTSIHFTALPKFKREIHFAGNPEKFLFPNKWDYDIPLRLYSSLSCTGKNVLEMGWMEPDALLLELAKGGFGLLWYGDDFWRQYMGYNNSMKLSTYLAAGIPVIVPQGISNQYLIEKNRLGIVVNSLEEAVERVKDITEQEYQEYVDCVGRFAILLRNGYFTKKLLVEAVHALFREDLGGSLL